MSLTPYFDSLFDDAEPLTDPNYTPAFSSLQFVLQGRFDGASPILYNEPG